MLPLISMIMVSLVDRPRSSSLRTDRAPLPAPRGPVRLSARHMLTARLSVTEQGGKGRGLPARFDTWPPISPGCTAGRLPASLPGAARLGDANRAGASSWRPCREPAPCPCLSRRTGGSHKNGPPPSAGPEAAGPPKMPLGATEAHTALVCTRSPEHTLAAPADRPVAESPGPAPRESDADQGPGVRGRQDSATGRGAGGGARGAAAAHPGRALGVCPGAGHAAHRNRAGVASLAGMRATRRASPRMHRLRPHHQCVAIV